MTWCPTSAKHAPVTSPTYPDPTIAIFIVRSEKSALIASKNSCGLWQGRCLQPTRRVAWHVVCGVSQRLEIEGLKFSRFGDHALLPARRVVRRDECEYYCFHFFFHGSWMSGLLIEVPSKCSDANKGYLSRDRPFLSESP